MYFFGFRKLGHYNWWAIVCLMLAMKVRNAHISWALKCFMFLIGILFHWTWLEQIEWEIDREKKKNALMRKHSIKEEWLCLDEIPCYYCRGRVEVFVGRKLYVRFAIVLCVDTGSLILMNMYICIQAERVQVLIDRKIW